MAELSGERPREPNFTRCRWYCYGFATLNSLSAAACYSTSGRRMMLITAAPIGLMALITNKMFKENDPFAVHGVLGILSVTSGVQYYLHSVRMNANVLHVFTCGAAISAAVNGYFAFRYRHTYVVRNFARRVAGTATLTKICTTSCCFVF